MCACIWRGRLQFERRPWRKVSPTVIFKEKLKAKGDILPMLGRKKTISTGKKWKNMYGPISMFQKRQGDAQDVVPQESICLARAKP